MVRLLLLALFKIAIVPLLLSFFFFKWVKQDLTTVALNVLELALTQAGFKTQANSPASSELGLQRMSPKAAPWLCFFFLKSIYLYA